ncbi:SRPBCC family protein [Longivirga aurantiaca]|uniref:SRPBCC family protein n=1 Tax=Longivirga aurantiaca TaxID=1837743 RepID=A0ABW1T493_9ACTN
MTSHEHTVVVDRPLATVYDQWTQFESYPRFMDDVESVRQIDDTTTHWRVSVGGVSREYDATITEQHPGEVIAWQSVTGPEQGGRVSFASLDPDHTRVTLRMDLEPHGVAERVGDALGIVSSAVSSSLEKFKEFIEERGTAEGGWHGTVEEGDGITSVDLTDSTLRADETVDTADRPVARMEDEGGSLDPRHDGPGAPGGLR